MMVERTQQLKCNLWMISNQNISRLGARQPNNFRWLQLTLTIIVRWWLGGWDSGSGGGLLQYEFIKTRSKLESLELFLST